MVLKILLLFCISFYTSLICAENKVQNKKVAPINEVKVENKRKTGTRFITIGLHSFQDDANISTPYASKNVLNTTTYGTVFGYTEAVDLKSIRLETNLGLFVGTTDARAESDTFDYQKTKTTSIGLAGGFALLGRFDKNNDYFFGTEINLFYRYSKWINPVSSSGTWTITPVARLYPTIMIEGEYHYQKLVIFHKFGLSPNTKALVWNLGVGYSI
jgi:hypothetical protein